jgi:hypothetical protein
MLVESVRFCTCVTSASYMFGRPEISGGTQPRIMLRTQPPPHLLTHDKRAKEVDSCVVQERKQLAYMWRLCGKLRGVLDLNLIVVSCFFRSPIELSLCFCVRSNMVSRFSPSVEWG